MNVGSSKSLDPHVKISPLPFPQSKEIKKAEGADRKSLTESLPKILSEIKQEKLSNMPSADLDRHDVQSHPDIQFFQSSVQSVSTNKTDQLANKTSSSEIIHSTIHPEGRKSVPKLSIEDNFDDLFAMLTGEGVKSNSAKQATAPKMPANFLEDSDSEEDFGTANQRMPANFLEDSDSEEDFGTTNRRMPANFLEDSDSEEDYGTHFGGYSSEQATYDPEIMEMMNAILQNEDAKVTASENKVDLKITSKEIDAVKTFYSANKEKLELESKGKPTHFRANTAVNPLNYSFVFVPEKSTSASVGMAGLNLLLKTKGAEIIGQGATGRVTLSLNINKDTPSDIDKVHPFLGAFKSTKHPGDDDEMTMNRLIIDSGLENLMAGIPVSYEGSFTERSTSKEDATKEYTQKEGYLMPLAEGGELFEMIMKNEMIERKGGNVDRGALHQAAISAAESGVSLHKLDIVHNDIKPENFLVTKDGNVKMSDFGSAVKEGSSPCFGTPGFMSPELLSFKDASKASDIWSFGCVLASMYHGDGWFSVVSSAKYNFHDKIQFEMDKKGEFNVLNSSDSRAEGHIDFIIDQCLQLDPSKRPNFENVVEQLKKFVENDKAGLYKNLRS